jgi:hypothetical protein
MGLESERVQDRRRVFTTASILDRQFSAIVVQPLCSTAEGFNLNDTAATHPGAGDNTIGREQTVN